MPMIPVSYAVSAILALLLFDALSNREEANRSHFFISFLCVQIFQLLLIGTRFGYGVEQLQLIQPFTASLIPPLAYLSFKNPVCKNSGDYTKLWVHALPFVLTILTTSFALVLMDAVLGVSTLVYAGALIAMGLRGQSALPWVTIGRTGYIMRLLWLTAGFLLISGVTDLSIAADFWTTNGHNTGQIAGIATTTSIIIFSLWAGIYFWIQHRKKQRSEQIVGEQGEQQNKTGQDKEILNQIDEQLQRDQLYLDPDLNLNKLARKTGIPARQVSATINQQTDLSVSQYINQLRIDEACRLLSETEKPVTQVMLEAGFNTKSNFNKEFKRKTGLSPSQWRQENQPYAVAPD